jgi:pimeloyl-ACP methyl ester carboxylesterase
VTAEAIEQMEPPSSCLDRLESRAQLIETPCGDGSMRWYAWGEGPVLVLLHGGAGSWRHWVRNIPFFAPHYRVLVPDLPGMGCSAMPLPPFDPASIAAIIAKGIDGIVGTTCRYDLVGFSFGGAMAGDVALLHESRLRSLTIVGTGSLGIRRNSVTLMKVRHLEGAARRAAHATNLARMMLADPSAIDDLAIEIQDINTRHARLKTPDISGKNSLPAALAILRLPLNAIYGARDSTLWPRIAERESLYRNLRPDVDFRRLPNAGHWLIYEEANEFNAILAGMLARTSPQPHRICGT